MIAGTIALHEDVLSPREAAQLAVNAENALTVRGPKTNIRGLFGYVAQSVRAQHS